MNDYKSLSSDFFHEPMMGSDGIERCRFCRQSMTRQRGVVPAAVPCPALDSDVDPSPMVTDPLNAFLLDLTYRREISLDERYETPYRLPQVI